MNCNNLGFNIICKGCDDFREGISPLATTSFPRWLAWISLTGMQLDVRSSKPKYPYHVLLELAWPFCFACSNSQKIPWNRIRRIFLSSFQNGPSPTYKVVMPFFDTRLALCLGYLLFSSMPTLILRR